MSDATTTITSTITPATRAALPPAMVLDIETIPPPREENPIAWEEAEAKAKRSKTKKDASYYLATDPDALNICCICAYDTKTDEWLRMFAENAEKERELLLDGWQWVKERHDQGYLLVTHAGKTFDIPAMYRRAMLQDVYVWRGLVNRIMGKYASDQYHLDTMQSLAIPSPFGAPEMKGLDYYCRMFGIPGKVDGWSGDKVWPAFREGFSDPGYWESITLYCENDVVALTGLFERVAPWLIDSSKREGAAAGGVGGIKSSD